MALFTIADFEDATGYEVEPEDEPKVQFVIDAVSNYITDYCGTDFVVIEDHTERCHADYYGVVLLPPPVSDVSSVKNARTQEELSYWDWDDDRRIFNLCPNEVVDVTYSGGYAEVPDSVFTAAIDVAKATIYPPGSNSMVQFTVGDVSEKYFKGRISSLIDDLALDSLDSFRETEGTWALGPRTFNPPTDLPTM